jgi:hypothetical protein
MAENLKALTGLTDSADRDRQVEHIRGILATTIAHAHGTCSLVGRTLPQEVRHVDAAMKAYATDTQTRDAMACQSIDQYRPKDTLTWLQPSRRAEDRPPLIRTRGGHRLNAWTWTPK